MFPVCFGGMLYVAKIPFVVGMVDGLRVSPCTLQRPDNSVGTVASFTLCCPKQKRERSRLFLLRYLVADTLPCGGKAMAGCVSRLREALNILPRTDSQSLGEAIAATLSAGRSILQEPSPSTQSARNGEQQDLRQQQVSDFFCQ